MRLKWLSYLINTLAFLLIAASLFVLLAVVLTPAGQVPQVFGYSVLRVMTGSMEPEIPVESMLLVKKTDPQTLEVGDIISFFSPDPELGGAVNTHRIVRIETPHTNLRFVTRGDANVLEDPQTVAAAQVVGKVILISPLLGRIINTISQPLVFGLIILVPLAIMMICNLVSALRSASRLAREEEEQAVRQALEELRAKKAEDTGRKT